MMYAPTSRMQIGVQDRRKAVVRVLSGYGMAALRNADIWRKADRSQNPLAPNTATSVSWGLADGNSVTPGR